MNPLRSQLATRAALIGSEINDPTELYNFLFEDVEECRDIDQNDILERRKIAWSQADILPGLKHLGF